MASDLRRVASAHCGRWQQRRRHVASMQQSAHAQLAELTLEGSGRDMPCFRAGRATIDDMRARFQPELSRRQCARFVDDMINRSLDHWTTTCYDKYQRCWLGIM